jgi:hypothetical protein
VPHEIHKAMEGRNLKERTGIFVMEHLMNELIIGNKKYELINYYKYLFAV